MQGHRNSLGSIRAELANDLALDPASAAFESVRNGRATPFKAFLEENPSLNPYQLKDGDGNTALHYAASSDLTTQGSMEQLLALFSNDLDPLNDEGQTPLHHAADQGNLIALSALLNAGAQPNQCDLQNDTALLKAIRGHTPALRLALVAQLVKFGADVNIAKNGGTPLHSAAWHGDLGLVKYLLRAPAPGKRALLNTLWQGKTPLCVAAERGHEALVTYLLSQGAKPDIGKLPEHAAKENGHHTIASQIERATPFRPISKPGSAEKSIVGASQTEHKFDPIHALNVLRASSECLSTSSSGSLVLG